MGHQRTLVGGESLDFPTRKLDLRRSFSQPRKNVDKHFCLEAEISIAPASHLGVEGRSPHALFWFVFCRAAKNEHQRSKQHSAPEGRSMCVKRRSCLAFAPSMLPPSHPRSRRAQYVRKEKKLFSLYPPKKQKGESPALSFSL